MGKAVSSINIFSSCFKSKQSPNKSKEESKEESKVPAHKNKNGILDDESIRELPGDISLDSFADGSNKTLTQIGLHNNDGYYTASELKYYQNLYKDEKIEIKPLTAIK